MTHNTAGSLTVFIVAALIAASAHGQDALLQDPGFEADSEGDSAWSTFEVAEVSGRHARTGDRSMFNGAFSRTVAYQPYFVGMVSGSYQELDAAAGSQWRLTGYAMTPIPLKGTPAFGILQVSFFDAEGNDLGTVETTGDEDTKAKTSNEITARAPAGEWLRLDTGIATAPAGAASIQAFTLYVDYSGSNTSQGVFFDDLTLCEVSDDNSCQ